MHHANEILHGVLGKSKSFWTERILVKLFRARTASTLGSCGTVSDLIYSVLLSTSALPRTDRFLFFQEARSFVLKPLIFTHLIVMFFALNDADELL